MHKKIISLHNHTFHYGVCTTCGDEIILSEYPKGARVKHTCHKCKYIKNKQYQSNYKRVVKTTNDKCHTCNKDIIRSNKYRSSTGNSSHYYFCSNSCKIDFKEQKEQQSKQRQKDLDPELVAKLMKEFL
jgi:YHS domain-containing protein